MSFPKFQHDKTPLQGIKTRSSKSRKIDIFLKGLINDFGPKMAIFPTFFFQAIQAKKMSFTKFQNDATPFQAIKTRSSKCRKINIFPNGLTHGFGPKVAIFGSFFFIGNIGQENVFYDILERKTPFQPIKRRSSKSRKIDIFSKGLIPGLGPKIAIFPTFFSRQFRTGKCLLVYSRTKKRLSRL